MTVTVEDLCVSFGGQPVLRTVNALFPAQCVSVVVGRSGSGKTTLLRAINRLNEEFPGCTTTGRVWVDWPNKADKADAAEAAEAVTNRRDVYASGGPPLTLLRQRVGMLFQTPNCFPVSVWRNMSMPLALVGGVAEADIPGRVRDALEAVGLWEELQGRLDTAAHSLSGGQQQRLCLARLLALRPGVLLLDEPTASLDVHATREIEALLRGLAARYTLIMVSHSLAQAGRMADQTLVCREGRVAPVPAFAEHFSEARLEKMLEHFNFENVEMRGGE